MANQGWAIEADGINFWNRKEIIDDLRIYPEKDGRRVPKINISRSELGLLSKISFGESRANVERALGKKVVKDTWTQFAGLLRYPRKPVNKDSRTYTSWYVVFIFDADKLTGLQMTAD